MLRRSFLKFAAAVILCPALDWSPIKKDLAISLDPNKHTRWVNNTETYNDLILRKRQEMYQSMRDALEENFWSAP